MNSIQHGMHHDLARLITTHLFVLCPNNSGSTFVKNALATSNHTWNLDREGQHAFGFVGPRPREQGRQLLWAAAEEWIADYVSDDRFDWSTNRAAWYSQATSTCPDAEVFVEKSPPFLLVADQLRRSFEKPRFVMMVRNPYATYEGILRSTSAPPPGATAELGSLAATHVIACLEHQRRNIDRHDDIGVFFTYEELCAQPRRCAEEIATIVPGLSDLNFDQPIAVKRRYNDRLRNMNDEQLDRLSRQDLDTANKVFGRHGALLESFGYEVL